jgi:hypothetical protein
MGWKGNRRRSSDRRGLLGPLTLASSLVWLLVLPAASAVAETVPTVTPGSVHLTASASQVAPGGSVTFTASAQDPNGTPEYQFWVEEPNGQWIDAQNYSTDSQFTLANVSSGSYVVAVDVMDRAQVAAKDWSAAQTTLPDGVFVQSRLVVVSLNQDAAPGTPVTLLAQATNIYDPVYQFWVQAPDGTWSQSGAYSTSSTYTFKPSLPGTYRFVAYAKSPAAANNADGALQSAVGTTGVYGTASQVVLTVQSPSLVADGSSTDTVTATVEDQYGNRVANFSGAVVLSASGGAVMTSSFNSTATGTVEVLLAQGMGTASVTLPTGDTTVNRITADNLDTRSSLLLAGGFSGQGQVANVAYGSATISGVANSAYALSLQSGLADLSVDEVSADPITVGITDAAGYPYATRHGRYVTLSLTGPGSFAGASIVTTVQEYIPAGTTSGTVTVPVYSIQGEPGTIQVTATASGILPAAPLDISTYRTGAPAGLDVTQTNGIDSAGDVYTVYAVAVVDQAGHILTTGAGATDAIQISDNVAALGDPYLDYYTGSKLEALVGGNPKGDTVSDAGTTVANPVVLTANASGGVARFAVTNTQIGLPATITALDLSTGATASAGYNYYYNVGPVVAYSTTPLDTRLAEEWGPQSVAPGQTFSFSAQMSDIYGNPLPEKGQSVWFGLFGQQNLGPTLSDALSTWEAGPYNYGSLLYPDMTSGLAQLPNGDSGNFAAYQSKTNSSGVATIQVSIPSGAEPWGQFWLTPTTFAGGASPVSYAVVPPAYQPATVSMQVVTDGVPIPADQRVTAGTPLELFGEALNALGQPLVSGMVDPFNYALLTSSNPGVAAAVGTSWEDYAQPIAPGEWLISLNALFLGTSDPGYFLFPLQAMASGTTTLTLQDLAPGVPPVSDTITVVPGTAVREAELLYNGAPVSAMNPIDLTQNQPVAITVVNVDQGGNPVPVTGGSPVTVELPTTLTGEVAGTVNWEPVGGGTAISSVQIPPGQTSATVWFVSSVSQVVSLFPQYAQDLVP